MTSARWGRLGLTLALLALALQAARLALHKGFSIDEFQYAHAAWLVSKGQVPYRDFFEVHFPLVYQGLAPLFWLVGDAPRGVLALRLAMLVPLAGACVSVAVLNRREGRVSMWLAPVLLLALTPFTRFAVEIRPDALACALFLGGLAALSVRPGTRGLGFVAGVLFSAAFWSSQKVLFHGGVVGAVLAVDIVWRRGRGPALVARPVAFLAGAGVGLAAVASYLTVTGSWGAWWQWCFAWAAEHQRHYPGFSWRDYLLPMVREQPWLFALAVLGFLVTVRAWWRSGAERWGSADLPLLLAVLATFGSYALQRAPFPYSLLPFLGVLAPFMARGTVAIFSGWSTPPARVVAALALGVLLCLQLWRLEALVDGGGNARQRDVLARIAMLTGPEDVVYDNSGGYVSRPHAHFYFYTDAYLRGSIPDVLAREVPQALVERGCVLRVDDLRTSGLPPSLRGFLDTYYQPYDGDLFLWGQRYDVSPGSALEGRFLAVRDGRYFVEPASMLESGALFVDGARVTEAELTLSRGEHTVRYEGPEGRLHLLWLPRDGQRWVPRPEAKPTYSRLF
ncbi:hypothetical protein FJV41_01375 [Myxococcus llanfairpwllgwyngyllgogerychwyrndrobwllllantysiliogogogochensis]|uniref:Glycosyltransferase RgtA/B/C/D-like domain-containing protein n=1 Tax=Myxococcus llanfairpwllgwyngyllgogerychwyrndrobwllllantysiliogogogochensis TaxID=2590453 RepID=A0A540X950_9BACT|nr:hypothetical protein [Myxococcus llanfairpwllgwyngyllgogerychwyrndrobwllllantysiliogogogochensis]TQF17823.1 hypothetical protein FJV41_01375 [Myxococcus llanfairpwllgwyngyllgogerychwyrndrobwllllantysiliogogogochensis]